MLEQGPLAGAGAVVKAPAGAGDWEFETGVQCLGGGDKLGRFVKRLQLAFLPADEGSGKGELEVFMGLGNTTQVFLFLQQSGVVPCQPAWLPSFSETAQQRSACPHSEEAKPVLRRT